MREKIRLMSTAGTGFFYTTTKNKRNQTGKMEIKKYDLRLAQIDRWPKLTLSGSYNTYVDRFLFDGPIAAGSIRMQQQTLQLISQGGHEKGDVLGIARIAAIMASKRTADLIPLCHPLALTRVEVEFEIDEQAGQVNCLVNAQTNGPTGVEMEALTAVQVGLLTIYDMCKALSHDIVIKETKLMEKTGGKRDFLRD